MKVSFSNLVSGCETSDRRVIEIGRRRQNYTLFRITKKFFFVPVVLFTEKLVFWMVFRTKISSKNKLTHIFHNFFEREKRWKRYGKEEVL